MACAGAFWQMGGHRASSHEGRWRHVCWDCSCFTVRSWRGVAFAAMGKIEEAEAELVKFTAALENKALEGRRVFAACMHNPQDHSGLLDVADAVLKGEIEYRKGNYPLAFQHLRLAVKRA